jgi:prolyl-tRNA synthetase
MLRGGMLRKIAGGLYSFTPLGFRALQKVQRIVREEMNRAGALELLLPALQPIELWETSGRASQMGKSMFRLRDRGDRTMVLGPTHEEVITDYMLHEISSYRQLPCTVYQIQTKFRDEPRARGGLIRVREFTMKDAYSFHTSKEDLEQYYQKCHKAYERIFARCGVPEVISVKSDSGMMGGKVAHEFMLCTPVGEDSLVVCSDCDFRANMETAECVYDASTGSAEELNKVLTPEMKTIEDVCAFLGKDKADSIKAVAYRLETDDSLCIVFIRGDIEVNETKLRNYLKSEVYPAEELEKDGIVAGFIGPKGLPEKTRTVFDLSLKTRQSYVCGANEENYHYTGLNIGRDLGEVQFVDVGKAIEGGICPVCGKKTLKLTRGIEVGNIFQLGDRYTSSMGMKYLDKDGSLKTPIMGCYGIGVGRLAASICEARHDDYGPIWPITIAPWQVQICALRSDDEQVKAYADKLYEELQDAGIEVLYDDRQVSAGFMFSDADLTGIPVRVVVSPKGLKAGTVEVSKRDKSYMEKMEPDAVKQNVIELVKTMMAELNNI